MTEAILIMTGSFNPVTVMHLRMMEIARDHLRGLDFVVRRGFVSPVHDGYGKAGLLPIAHRRAMLQGALGSSDWIRVSLWESEQPTWTPTYVVLQNLKSMYVENAATDDIALPSPRKRKRLSNTMTSNSVEDNPNQAVRVMFVCGADTLASFSVPNLWDPDHLEKILVEYGLVVITRIGYDIDKIIYETDLLHKHRKHIIVVREFIENSISSTAIRKACSRGLSIKYLVHENVEKYIKRHQLYSSGGNYVNGAGGVVKLVQTFHHR